MAPIGPLKYFFSKKIQFDKISKFDIQISENQMNNLTIDFILSGSTKYYEPLSCGSRSCDFGATCIKGDCLCEFDCQNGDSYYKEPVCGNDGNTYRTECQLRQYSCRIQKAIIIVKYEPCTDAPRAVYGQDSRQQDILSDGTGTITVYGLIGDQCLDDRDCFIDSTSCIEGK